MSTSLRLLTLFAIQFLIFGMGVSSAEIPPGDQLNVSVTSGTTPVEMTFHFCPSGEVQRGKPQPLPEPTGNPVIDKLKRGALLGFMRGFYMAKTEVSHAQYAAVMSEEAVNTVHNRLVSGESEGLTADYPIRGVTLEEAAEFCRTLQRVQAEQSGNTATIEARKYRLPTHDEWQYACRGVATADEVAEVPHFNSWPELSQMPKDILSDCQDTWTQQLRKTTEFVGTQEECLEVMLNQENPARGVEIFSKFLQAGIGGQRDYATTLTSPRPVGASLPNRWQLQDFHGNVFEWTLVIRNQDEFSAMWDSYLQRGR
ncbi:MAG: SUMF1/EgtB/PvdO family nonheme iron enzyme [Planctomycetaceae bacterium]